MRFSLLFAAVAAASVLAACATSSPPAVSSPVQSSSAPTPVTRNWASDVFASAGTARAPARAEVERQFGTPDVARQDGAGATLTYRLPTCALMMLFTADARGELRLAQANAGPRRTGEAAPSLDQCAAEAAARGPRR